MISSFKLPFRFDSELLRSDLNQIRADEWVSHFNKEYHDGGWSGVALRSAGGIASQLYTRPQEHLPFAETPLLERCPYVRELLQGFHCPISTVRFLRLAPGSQIKEHRDSDLTFETGQVRLHIPVATNAQVQFFLDAERIEMQLGDCWFLNFSLPHWIKNQGSTDRIHLVIDCELNDWLRGLFSSNTSDGQELISLPSSPAEFERFRLHVLRDQQLQQRLRQTSDRESFIRLVVREGQARGYRFTAQDTEKALLTAQQSWFARWID